MKQKQRKKHKKHRRDSSPSSDSRKDRKQRSRNKDRHRDREDSRGDSPRRQKKDKKHEKRQSEAKVKLEKGTKREEDQRYEGWRSSRQNSPQKEPKMEQMVKQQDMVDPEGPPQKQQPNFEPSGILLEFYNAREGIALKFHQPAESHAPIDQWRIYPFKDNSPLSPIILKKSCYLIGKDQRICDILCQNSSISRQHAVIQFRSQYKPQLDGSYSLEVKPYIMDLESTNGTVLNGEKIQASRYYELLEKDILRFGLSEREYVMFKVEGGAAEGREVEE